MNSLYRPLREARDEIRLLTILPESRTSDVLHCAITTLSQNDLTPEYSDFLSLNSKTATPGKRAQRAAWISHCSQTQDTTSNNTKNPPPLATLESPTHLRYRQPPSTHHRFQWGDYAALSYVWGDESDTVSIMVNGRPKWVTANLASALRVFADSGEFEYGSGAYRLWVDALCINQDDLVERRQQVQRMGRIYGSAWAVIAWLGEASFKSDDAIGLVRDLALLSRAGCGSEIDEHLRREPDYLGKGCWLALMELMERPYWYRLWVIQEMIMGASVTWVRCGSSCIDWDTFCEGVAFLEEALWLVKDWLLRWEDRTASWSVGSLHLIYKDLSMLAKREDQGGDHPSFGRLLDIANSAGCKDPRDKIYGLIALMSAEIAGAIKPDYALPVRDVYAAAARVFIERYDNLEPIREANPWGPANGPSWAADWLWRGRRRWSRIEERLWGPTHIFPSSGARAPLHTPYRASGDARHDSTFSPNGSKLTCSGVIVDRVSGLSARGVEYFAWDGFSVVGSEEWSSIYGGWEETREALYRTLVMDRVKDGEQPTANHAAILSLPAKWAQAGPEFEKRGWQWLAGQMGYYFRWEGFRTTNAEMRLGRHRLDDFFEDTMPDEASEFHYTEVYSCFDRSLQKRRFMTTVAGYMGWAPDNIYGRHDQQTKVADLIAVLFGCSTPVIIRPRGSDFVVIGEAYVQGLMEGEVMQMLKEGKFEPRRFTFV